MIDVGIDKAALKELQQALGGIEKDIPKHVSVVVNKTQTATFSFIAKTVVKHVKMKQKDVKSKLIKGPRSTKQTMGTTITIPKTKRLGIEKFGARQNKKGVRYTMSAEGSTLAASAFMGPKPGVKAPRLNGGAFKRRGKARLPIYKLRGPSVWGVITENHEKPNIDKFVQQRLNLEMKKRIDFIIAKREGKI